MLLGGGEPDRPVLPAAEPAPAVAARPPSRWTSGTVPGEAGLWVFLIGDMLAFGLFFGVFMVQRGDDPEAFRAGRETLDVGLGVADTLLLLTGSILVVLAMRALREDRARLATRLLLGAITTGVLFAIGKAVEYASKIDADLGPRSGDFYTLYFGFTGIHLVHLLIGVVGLSVMVALARRPSRDAHDQALLESGATFWHLVDLLWLVLFPLFYLVA